MVSGIELVVGRGYVLLAAGQCIPQFTLCDESPNGSVGLGNTLSWALKKSVLVTVGSAGLVFPQWSLNAEEAMGPHLSLSLISRGA